MDECDNEVFTKGTPVCHVDSKAKPMEEWVKQLRADTGQKVDWHYFAGWAAVKTLGDPDALMHHIEKVGGPKGCGFMRIYWPDTPEQIQEKEHKQAEHEAWTKRMFAKTVAIVAANSYESLGLWREWHERLEWAQENVGLWHEIGKIGDLPVCVTVFWQILNGKTIAFFDVTSRASDSEMVEKWLLVQAPKVKYTHDALNFHNALHDAGVKWRGD